MRTLPARLVAVALGFALSAALLAAVNDGVRRRAALEPAASPAVAMDYGNLPIAFEANGGRTDQRVDYLARGAGWSLFLTPGESVISLAHGTRRAVVRAQLLGASRSRGVPAGGRTGTVNSFAGNDRSRWRTGIPSYAKVRYTSVYPGIDLVYYGHSGRLEYDFAVAPGGNPARIALGLKGGPAQLARNGDLVVRTAAGAVRQKRPDAYQVINGRRRRVSARFVLDGTTARISTGRYDHTRPLLIDPVLAYSGFVGGSGDDQARSIAVGPDGSAYITGITQSTDFPVDNGSSNGAPVAIDDGFVTKINPAGTARVYSTYFGGTQGAAPNGIAVDASGRAYVAGEVVGCGTFPLSHEVDSTCSGGEMFTLGLSPGGDALLFSTYLGGTGTELHPSIALASGGGIVVAGTVIGGTGYPTTSNAYRSTAPASLDADIVLTKLAYDPAGTPALRIDYSTYFGGSGYDLDPAVAVDDNDFVFVTGVTRSSDFPTRNAAQATPGDEHDAFVAKFDTSPAPNPGDASLIWSTYYGGSSTDIPHGIALDGQEVFVVGETQSTDLPSTEAIGPFTHVTDGSETDAFLVSFLATGQSDGVRDATTYIGGTGYDSASGVVARRSYGGLDVQYIVGTTDASSSNFPLRGSLSDSVGGTKHVWVMKLQTSPQIIWSTLLGGSSGAQDIGAAIAQNRFAQAPGAEFRDHVYITGFAGGDYPHTDTLQPSFGGGVDAFVSRIDEAQPQIFSPEPGRVRPTGTIAFTYGVPQHNDGLSFACSEGADPDNPGHLENQLISCPVGSKSYTGLAEGPQLFQVQTVDESGDRSEPTEFPFVVDLNPPPAFDLVAPDDGARTGTTPTLQWQQAHDAATAVTYHVIVGGSDVVQVPESVCSANTCSVKLAALPTGSHTWQVHAVDEGQHARDSGSTRTFTAVSPPAAALTISPNPALIGRAVTFDASASADAAHTIAKYEWDLDGDGTFELDTGGTPTATRSYDAVQTVHVTVRVTDSTGSTGTAAGDLKVSAIAIPSNLLGVTVNAGAQYTRSPDVTVTTNFPAGITSMVFANDGGFLTPTTFPPQNETKWKLDSSGPERLPKTIYVRFFTGVFPSETFTDDIILDETPPKVDSASVAPVAAASVARTARLRSWKAKLKATDSNSGVQFVQLTSNKKKPGKLLKYKQKLTVKSAKRPKWVRARDRAGNYSRWRKAR